MDIANQLGVNGQTRALRPAAFVVSLAGLVDNATFGLCAERGVPLQVQTSGWEGAPPAGITYQWHAAGSPIAGAITEHFTPDASLLAESALHCVVTAPGFGSVSSPAMVLRDPAPTLGPSLSDEIFDLDTGVQIVPAAAAFSGAALQFSVSGAGATIDPNTGDISIPTQNAVVGAQVIVTAANSGGSANAGFQVTIEDTALEGAIPFGALTPAGAGGIPVNGTAITQGDPGGHWQITAGFLVPTAAGEGSLSGVYPLEFDNGDTLDLLIEDDKASARVEELVAVFDALPVSARGLLVQDGDARHLGRLRLAPKVFTQEMVLEPTNWLEDADPRQSQRPVTLGGLSIGGDPSGERILRMENLTVQGFECYDAAPYETHPDQYGVIEIERPSRHVTVRQNEIRSRSMVSLIELATPAQPAGGFYNNFYSSGQKRGISTSTYSGFNEHLVLDENHIHDIGRGIVMVGARAHDGQRSRLCGNVIEDAYQNFFTCGYCNGLDIFDNKGIHIWAAERDTTGAIPATSPHSSVGGSFDAGGPRTTQNISMLGNFLHSGSNRKVEAQRVLGGNYVAADHDTGITGIKFNDPGAPDSYYNLEIGYNTVVAEGIALEIEGGENVDMFNNTLASNPRHGGSSQVNWVGITNLRMWHNVAPSYRASPKEGTGFYPRTAATASGYGNVAYAGNRSHALQGDGGKGFLDLTLDEAIAAHQINPARTGLADKGASAASYQGEGIYTGGYSQPVSTQASYPYPLTAFRGGAHLALTGPRYPRGHLLTIGIQGRIPPGSDGVIKTLVHGKSQRIFLRLLGSGTPQVFFRNADDEVIAEFKGDFTIDSTDGLFALAVAIDMDNMRCDMALNGVPQILPLVADLTVDDIVFYSNEAAWALADDDGTDPVPFDLGKLFIVEEFIDFATSAGLSQVFAADGLFKDLRGDGTAITGKAEDIVVYGDAANLASHGDHAVNIAGGGSVTDTS